MKTEEEIRERISRLEKLNKEKLEFALIKNLDIIDRHPDAEIIVGSEE